MRNRLFNVKLINFIPRFILFFGVSLLVLTWVNNLISDINITFVATLTNIPLHLALAHAFVFATTESVIFQGYLTDRLGVVGSSMIAGLFHLFIWPGSLVLVFIGATILFLIFSYVHWYFKKNDNDFGPVIAFHSAYNFTKLVTFGG